MDVSNRNGTKRKKTPKATRPRSGGALVFIGGRVYESQRAGLDRIARDPDVRTLGAALRRVVAAGLKALGRTA